MVEPTERTNLRDALFDASSAAMLVMAPDAPRFTILDVNEAYLAATMSVRENLVGRAVFEVFPDNPNDKNADGVSNSRASIERAIAGKKPDTFPGLKFSIKAADGSYEERWWDSVNAPVFDSEGKVIAVIHTAIDVTERYRVALEREKAIEERERLAAVVEQSQDFIGIADAAGRGLYVSPGARHMCGLPDDFDPKSVEIIDFFLPEDHDYVRSVVLPAQASPSGFQGELRFRRFDGGEPVAVSYDGFAIRDQQGEITAFATVTRNIAEVKWARAVREAHNSILELAVKDIPLADALDGLVIIVEGLAKTDVMASVLLVDEDGEHLLHGAGPSLPAAYNEAIHGIEIGPAVGSCGTAVFRREPVLVSDIASDPLWADFKDLALSFGLRACWSTPILSTTGEVLGTFAMYHGEPREPASSDFELVAFVVRSAALLIERKRAEQRVRESEERLRQLNETLERRVEQALAERKLLADVVEGADASLQILGNDLNFLAINPRAQIEYERVFGVRPVAGMTLTEVLAHLPEQRIAAEAVWRRVLAGESFDETSWWGDDACDRRAYQMNFRPLRNSKGEQFGAYLFSQDVTEKELAKAKLREAEEALTQSQKMEAMGQLTGGVAHDFNNLLQPIVGSLDMLRRKGLGGEREQRLIENAMQSAERAKTLVQRLLAFARRQPLQTTAVDINDLVVGMTDLIRSTLGPQIDIAIEISDPGNLPFAHTDTHQLEMALLNLSVNARDAMPHGGKLSISAAAVAIGPDHVSKLMPGQYVRLSVGDTGIGMDEQTMARAVEPFFSTKGVGKGTGLGLSMVHGLASQLGGGLSIESKPGIGTTINLWLPVSYEATEHGTTAAEAITVPHEAGTALLVDDEISVRTSTSDMLQELGYEVIEAASAEEALALLRQGIKTDVLVTDHLMPGITGIELARIVRLECPAMPILLVSGYAERQGVSADLARLTKPFRSEELAKALAGVRAATES